MQEALRVVGNRIAIFALATCLALVGLMSWLLARQSVPPHALRIAEQPEQADGESADAELSLAAMGNPGADVGDAPAPEREPVAAPAPEPPAPPARAPEDPHELRHCPKDFENGFNTLRNLGRRFGEEWRPDLVLPASVWRELQAQYEQHEAARKPLMERWWPLIEAVKEDKWKRGEYEHFVHPDTIEDPEERKAQAKRISKAMEYDPRTEHVSTRGAGPNLWFIRIRADDSAELAGVWAQMRPGWQDLVGASKSRIAPHLASQPPRRW